jgi:pimeloyl-ACP methyl ester carboxylesterase
MDRIETRLITANGLSFETDVAGSGDRFALLLHGFPENKHSWRFQLPQLAELGYTAWAPNLRGYGATSRPKERSAYALDHLMDDVAALFEAARKERDFKELVLVGHDWGAWISWAVAIRQVIALDKLVIMNVPHPVLFQKGLRSPAQMRRSWYIFFFLLPWLAETALGAGRASLVGRLMRDMAIDKTNFSDHDLMHFRQAAAAPGAITAMLNYYRANYRSLTMRRISRSSVPHIEIPTLMIWGEEDAALGKELTYGTERYVDDLTIRYLPGVSHWVQQEAPDQVNAMLAAFLQGAPVPTSDELRTRAA